MRTLKLNFKSILDYENTEFMLNKMSLKGFRVKKISEYTLSFEKSDGLSKNHKIIFLDKKEYDTQEELVRLFEDSGWEYVNQTNIEKMICLLFQSDSSLNLDAYSDRESQLTAEHLIISRLFSKWRLFLILIILLGYLINFIEGKQIRTVIYFPLDLLAFGLFVYDYINRLRLMIKYKKKSSVLAEY